MKKGCLIALIIFLVLIVVALFVTFTSIDKYNKAIAYENKQTGDNSKVVVEIENGDTPSQIREKLIEDDVIKDEEIIFGFSAYRIYAFSTKFEAEIQAGTYLLEKGTSIREIATILKEAQNQEVKIQLPEGQRIEEIAEDLDRALNNPQNKLANFNKQEFITFSKNYLNKENKFEFLNERPSGNTSLEGYLFADTYFVDPATTATGMIELLLKTTNDKIYAPNITAIKASDYSFHELMTVASMLQREVITKDDMKLVAGVIYNRYEDRMPLGIDATTQYELGYSEKEGEWWRREILAKDLATDSPYNTRNKWHKGFIPGPISSMTVTAFGAALNPTKSDYYYYFSDAECATRFSKTYNEHLANIKKYGICS